MPGSQASPLSHDRLALIDGARRAVLSGAAPVAGRGVETWIERSWRRCLAAGRRPEQRLGFDMVPAQARKRVLDASQPLVRAARPVLDRLSRTLASTRYFAILTDGDGVVIDAHGPIDRSDRRADLITRVGVDLSERSVGTTAIGAALVELQPVWLHRGEHFFDDTSVYSCAGAPLFGPDGRCIGMLDLTGINAAERPELKHLAAQSVRSIENSLVADLPHSLLLRLNWPGRSLGSEDDGLVSLDGDGTVLGSNEAARRMLPQLALAGGPAHCSDLFAQPWEPLFDFVRHELPQSPLEVALWSGLRLLALPQRPGQTAATAAPRVPLRDVEIALIRKAVADARGNVQQAALALGISRATVYRKLGQK
ncbi:helix-turn-helix domain-containing protein [Ramlibacter sp. WS9]|uniref:helix-turn-helix domain-containing protein n=1 Tax=Ramlibacter sp. WS9 TaxID=1882741 RepID=UPI00114365CE|nr:helix-turn-helix domain-containing protein [Ramlibacter sp. WS9]ROZ76576.1 GAF domain-containing protein [Ramlibacter sp. WS9]